jgi:hypothetical protein
MRVLSATDAISPAWQHTNWLLLKPRSWRLLLKIGCVAVFAEMGGGFNFSVPGPMGSHSAQLPSFLSSAMMIGFVVIGVIGFLVGLALLYIGSRLQFVLFEVVLRRDTTVGPIWSRYGSLTWRWIGLKILFFLIALACALPIGIPVVLYFVHVVQMVPPESSGPGSAQMVLAIFCFVAFILLFLIAVFSVYLLLSDFGLPCMALEDTSIGVTVRRVYDLFRAEPGQILLYILMRIVLAIACGLAAEIIVFGAAAIALIPLGCAALILWAALHHGATASHVLMIAGWVILGIIFLAVVLAAIFMVMGFVYSFFRAYALFFLGGRNPLVGAYLEPLLTPVQPPYPPSGYPPVAPA